MKRLLITFTTVFLLSACTADAGRNMAEDECYKIRNTKERHQCFEDVDRTFREY
nr:lipoprotein [Enterovibrio nigricans]